MTTITDKLAAALLEASDYLAEFIEEGREHRVIKAADAALAEYDAERKGSPQAPTVWRLTHYGDEAGLFATLESAKAAVQPAAARIGFPTTADAEWRCDGMGTWHSVGIKGWEIDECEVLA